MAMRSFDTYMAGAVESLAVFLASVRDGRLVALAVKVHMPTCHCLPLPTLGLSFRRMKHQ